MCPCSGAAALGVAAEVQLDLLVHDACSEEVSGPEEGDVLVHIAADLVDEEGALRRAPAPDPLVLVDEHDRDTHADAPCSSQPVGARPGLVAVG